MTWISALWLPIIVATVVVFLASAIIHMAPLWHKKDYPAVPNETQVSDALRPFAIPPGDYMLPGADSMEQMKSPEYVARVLAGPNMIITVLPNAVWTMGRNLGLWFLYCLIVSAFAACIADSALSVNAQGRGLFHIAAMTAFLGYAVALWQMSIWYRRAWSSTLKATLDGVIYALLTAAAFGWVWPR
jgi:hypothetical protein